MTIQSATPLKVTFLIPDFHDGGAQKQCIALLSALNYDSSLDLRLIYFHEGVNHHLLDFRNIKVTRVPPRVESNYNPLNVVDILKVLRRDPPDVLLTWLHAADVYGYFLRKLSRRMTWLMTERDSSYPRDKRFWLRRKLGRHADGIICNSEQGKKYWQLADARGPMFVVPNIVAPAPQYPEQVRKAGAIAYVGRLEAQKNVLVLAQALCDLATRRPELSFAIVGDGRLRPEIESIISRTGVGGRVTLTGFRRDAVELIARSRLLVSLSHNEGTPNVMLEGVSAGIPIVASDIPEHRSVLGDDYPFLVRDRHDVNDARSVIERALAAEEATEILRPARERVNRMTAENAAASYAKIFHEMAQRSAGRGSSGRHGK